MMIVDRVVAEIVEFHQFLAQWFQGAIENSEEAFRFCLADRLALDFVNIQPAGRVLGRQDLIHAIQSGYGTNSDFDISIHQVQIRWLQQDAVLATYVEQQKGARYSTPPENWRFSTLLLLNNAETGGFLWQHLQETALPGLPG